jgi:hypothetical protein
MGRITHGSEWRRWELHLHTPETMKNDDYEGSTPEDKWNRFYKTIDEYIADGTDPGKTICAVAITDYLSIKNYQKVKKDKRLPNCIQLIMPNIEMRLSLAGRRSPVNIHCIFSPDIDGDIERKLLEKLTFNHNGKPYTVKEESLIEFGRDFSGEANMDQAQAYKIGIDKFMVDRGELFKVINDDISLRKKIIVVIPNGSDGATEIVHNDNQMSAVREALYQGVDMIYSSNPKDIKYFLGEGPDTVEEVRRKCGSLKPCIHGCDAHKNEEVFSPAKDRFCWIKADPTFEGFKQLLYEPGDRVRICATMPESKEDYHVIDRVEFTGEGFNQDPIYFSDKLTCIIGGKSTGKSILLHNMALSIDKEHVEKRLEKSPTKVRGVETKVFWRDATENSEKKSLHKIVYIPQTYLNRLSDEQEETTEIDKIVQDILMQNESISSKHKEMADSISSSKYDLANNILKLITVTDQIEKTVDSMGEIGDKTSIEKGIEKYRSDFDTQSKQFNITIAENEGYMRAVETASQLSQETVQLDLDSW